MAFPEELSRQRLLLGDDDCRRLAEARVLLVGVGGVGSWAGEMLVRSGVGRLVLMDDDVVHPSNCNRQLCALHSTFGMPKAQVLAARFLDIVPSASVEAKPERLTSENCGSVLEAEPWNYVLDAIDDRPAKLALLQGCMARGIPVVSSMGAANKLDIGRVMAADIGDTYGCPLAKCIRKQLRKLGIERGIRVVFSPELPPAGEEETGECPEELTPGEKRPLGTISYMPAEFGIRCASCVLEGLLAESRH